VALGEYEDKVIETDILEKKRGDLEVQSSVIQHTIEYNATPYKRIESILSGRINKFLQLKSWEKSYIDITLKLTDTYTGAVYWVTDMRGFVKDVIETIVLSLNKGKYTEPLQVQEEETAVKEETKTEKKKEVKTEEEQKGTEETAEETKKK